MKQCTNCLVRKDLSEFYPSKTASDGRASHCKHCKNEYARKLKDKTGTGKVKLTEAELRELLKDAWSDGYIEGQNNPNGYSDDEYRDKFIAGLIEMPLPQNTKVEKVDSNRGQCTVRTSAGTRITLGPNLIDIDAPYKQD